MTKAAQKLPSPPKTYILKLYVAGATIHSLAAVTNITMICTVYLDKDYDLEVIDIYQQPKLAQSEQILAAPTLILYRPEPIRRFIGDLSETKKVIQALGLKA